MNRTDKNRKLDFPGINFGITLIVVGGIWFLVRIMGLGIAEYLWPLFVIIPGATLLTAAVSTGFGAEKLTITGTVVTAIGMLLFYQNLFNHFESWAYAWALVLPAATGIGLYINGSIHHNATQIRNGQRAILAGVALFVAGAVFFELIINISGHGIKILGLGSYFWPALVVGLGLYVFLRKASTRSGE